MSHKSEIEFVRAALGRCNVRTVILERAEHPSVMSQQSDFSDFPDRGFINKIYTKSIDAATVYRAKDSFGFCYVYFLLPGGMSVFLAGPFISDSDTPESLLSAAEQAGMPPRMQRYLEGYLKNATSLHDMDHMIIILTTLAERLSESAVRVVEDNESSASNISFLEDIQYDDDLSEVLTDMRAMEQRYDLENEMIEAVRHGRLKNEIMLLSVLSDNAFEKRLPDLLRNAKNYCIIMNTLLRKAAENGGVHPLYIDRLSSDFAAKIEKMPSLQHTPQMMRDIFKGYCRLVREHSSKNYSLVVKNTVLLIDFDISADLSLSKLAAQQNVSAGYLCAIFKREVGKTVTEYVRDKRMEYACHLLATTELQVQTVALYCGIVDVQYFAKMFKRHTGKTPRDYRESIRADKA